MTILLYLTTFGFAFLGVAFGLYSLLIKNIAQDTLFTFIDKVMFACIGVAILCLIILNIFFGV